MAWLPISAGVRIWFDRFGETLDDQQSFRHQISRVAQEISEAGPFVAQLQMRGDPAAGAAQAELVAARELRDALRARLDAMVARSSGKAAR